MAYIDLFAGPGRYDDQSKSTPLMVLDTILSNPELANRMITIFNDKDAGNIKSLETVISEIEGIDQLKFPPRFLNMEVGEEITKMFQSSRLPPTFFFVDPWGYKGLSLNLVSSIIKDCDCVFFFNYNRVSMGIANDFVKPHMESLFGKEQLEYVRKECEKVATPEEREAIVVQELCNALKKNGNRFVLPFRFKNNLGTRTSHHLIFISKSFRGYDIMKEIMHKESTEKSDGVASFEFNPQYSLFNYLSRPLEELQNMLLQDYNGRTIDFLTLYEEHSVDKPYINKNYKEVLRTLYDAGKITAVNPQGMPPRKGTFSDKLRITFGGTK